MRRRAQEDVSKARKFGIESFAESLVPVKDSLEAALAQPEQTVDTLREGVEVTLKQLAAAFERNLLKEIAPAQGDKFDPHLHQAISSVPADQPANTVCSCCRRATPLPTARCGPRWWWCPPARAETGRSPVMSAPQFDPASFFEAFGMRRVDSAGFDAAVVQAPGDDLRCVFLWGRTATTAISSSRPPCCIGTRCWGWI